MEHFPVEGNDAFAPPARQARLAGERARWWRASARRAPGACTGTGCWWPPSAARPVKAVYAGRVIYADWLPGLGLLTIVDHGDGYMSLYGHNERLYKAVGERVAAGDTLAAAGDSGGSSRPELYFEIRKGGKPVDPRPWFKAADP